MDRVEGDSDWPRKRIRLEHTVESHLSYSTSQSNVVDRQRGYDGCGHGVYGREAPRLDLDRALYPSSWRHDTHRHLSLDYHITSSKVLTQLTLERSVDSRTSGAPNLSKHSRVFPGNDNGDQKADFTDEVCFGMVSLLHITLQFWD